MEYHLRDMGTKAEWHGNAGYGQRGTGWVGAGNRTWWNGDKREGEET